MSCTLILIEPLVNGFESAIIAPLEEIPIYGESFKEVMINASCAANQYFHSL